MSIDTTKVAARLRAELADVQRLAVEADKARRWMEADRQRAYAAALLGLLCDPLALETMTALERGIK